MSGQVVALDELYRVSAAEAAAAAAAAVGRGTHRMSFGSQQHDSERHSTDYPVMQALCMLLQHTRPNMADLS
jgi:hypothetical protein